MSESEDENVDWQELSEADPEEQPLVIAGKSFTELLEEKLRNEKAGGQEEEEKKADIIKNSPVIKSSRPFLRRGMGLTRSVLQLLLKTLRNKSFTSEEVVSSK